MTWVLDLDGVVWRGEEAIAGAPQAVTRLRAAGKRVAFVTNNSALTAAGYIQKLSRCGIDADVKDLVHGGHAVARIVEPGWKVLCVSGPGVVEAVSDRGGVPVSVDDVAGSPPAVDAVVVGVRADLGYRELSIAARGVLQCKRLLAPSADPLHPVADGFNIGGGSLTTAVAYATGVEPQFAGKPFAPMTEAVRDAFPNIEMVVGDQARSDGALAEQLGVAFALVSSGVTSAGGRANETNVPIAISTEDLAHVVDQAL